MAAGDVGTLTRRPEIIAALRDLAPAARLYVPPGSFLYVELWSSLAGQTVTVVWALLLPDGRLMPSVVPLTPSGDRALNTYNFPLAEGFLIALTAASNTATRGRTWLHARITNSPGAGDYSQGLLAQGYLTANDRVFAPPADHRQSVEGRGALRAITGTDPAAGVEISETVPTNALWRPHSLSFTYVASGAAATRQSSLVVDDGAAVYGRYPAVGAILAGQTFVISYGGAGQSEIVGGVAMSSSFPIGILLPEGHRMRTVTNNLQAGDNMTAPVMLVEEWLVE